MSEVQWTQLPESAKQAMLSAIRLNAAAAQVPAPEAGPVTVETDGVKLVIPDAALP